MYHRTLIIAGCMALCASRLQAQNPVQPVFANCPAPADLFSETQVQQAAHWLPDSARSPRPTMSGRGAPTVVSFVVDTLGVPERSGFARVRGTDSLLVERARSEFVRWRFTPALATGCKVRQRVVTAVTW